MTFSAHILLFLLTMGLNLGLGFAGHVKAQTLPNNTDIEQPDVGNNTEIDTFQPLPQPTNGNPSSVNPELTGAEQNNTYALAQSILIWEVILEFASLNKINFTTDEVILNALNGIKSNYANILNNLTTAQQISNALKLDSDALLHRDRHKKLLLMPNIELPLELLKASLESITTQNLSFLDDTVMPSEDINTQNLSYTEDTLEPLQVAATQNLSYTEDTLITLNYSIIMQEFIRFDSNLTIRLTGIQSGDLPLIRGVSPMSSLATLNASRQQLQTLLLDLNTSTEQLQQNIEDLTQALIKLKYLNSNYFLLHHYNIHKISLVYLWEKCLFSANVDWNLANGNLQVSQPLLALQLLANAYRRNNRLSQAQYYEIEDWILDNPNHLALPIAEFINQKLSYDPLDLPTKILVALPFTGAYATAGNSIRNGILNAYYKEAQYENWQPKIKFIDSNLFAYTQIIIAAESFGAQYILGPLNKKKVAQVLNRINYHPQIKGILALNWVEIPHNPDIDIWMYSLAAEQEIEEVALFAKTQGWEKGLGVYSESVWGIRTGHYFEKVWQDNDGEWIGSEGVSTQQISSAIGQDILLIDKSMARHRALRRYLDQELEFIPRRREDVDFIFHSSNSQHAARMLATLKFNFALGIPIITLSSAYQPNKAESQNDIEGVVFSDFPWILGITKPDQLSANPSDPEQLNRLYAMGVDSWHLMKNLVVSAPSSIFPYYGVTGKLFKKDLQKIWLTPVIAKYDNIEKKPVIFLNR